MDMEGSAASSGTDDRDRLRQALDAGATPFEVEEFVRRNKKHLQAGAEALLRRLTPLEQRHVMRRGDLPPDTCEPVLLKRLRESQQAAAQLKAIVCASTRRAKERGSEEAPEPPKAVEPAYFLAAEENPLMAAEVSASESRFAPSAGAASSSCPPASKAENGRKEGTVCGVGGVIEITKRKFGCDAGTRLRVLGEKGNLWQCEGGVGIVKFQKEGWRWVLRADVAEAQEKARRDEEEKKRRMRRAARGEASADEGSAAGDAQPPLDPERAARLAAISILQEREKVIAKEEDELRQRDEEERVKESQEKAAKKPRDKGTEREARKAKEAKQAKKARKEAAAKEDSDKDAKKARERAAAAAAKLTRLKTKETAGKEAKEGKDKPKSSEKKPDKEKAAKKKEAVKKSESKDKSAGKRLKKAKDKKKDKKAKRSASESSVAKSASSADCSPSPSRSAAGKKRKDESEKKAAKAEKKKRKGEAKKRKKSESSASS